MKKTPEWFNKIQGEALLLLAAIVWGTGFVAQRQAMDSMQPFAFISLRFLLGCLVLLPGLILKQRTVRSEPNESKHRKEKPKRNFAPGIIPGIFLFAGTSMQQIGIMTTSAAKAGFITSLYLVLVPLIGLFFGKKINKWVWFGVILAMLGVFYLSVDMQLDIQRGDIYMVVGALFWAVQILALDHFSSRTDSLSLAFGEFLTTACLGLVVSLVFEGNSLFTDSPAWGPLQVFGQSKVESGLASVIMSLEAVFALLGGMLFLGERLTGREWFGSGLMLAAVVMVQLRGQQRKTDPGVVILSEIEES